MGYYPQLLGEYKERQAAQKNLFNAFITMCATSGMIIALLPIVILGHAPGVEIIRPMAVVMIGSILASTLMTLFVMPALYDKFVGYNPSGWQGDGFMEA